MRRRIQLVLLLLTSACSKCWPIAGVAAHWRRAWVMDATACVVIVNGVVDVPFSSRSILRVGLETCISIMMLNRWAILQT